MSIHHFLSSFPSDDKGLDDAELIDRLLELVERSFSKVFSRLEGRWDQVGNWYLAYAFAWSQLDFGIRNSVGRGTSY